MLPPRDHSPIPEDWHEEPSTGPARFWLVLLASLAHVALLIVLVLVLWRW